MIFCHKLFCFNVSVKKLKIYPVSQPTIMSSLQDSAPASLALAPSNYTQSTSTDVMAADFKVIKILYQLFINQA